jgi:hypothetical protein
MMDNHKQPIKAIITGSTGMVGKGVLLECLDNPAVEEVLVVNRQPLGISHPKLKELIHTNFMDLSSIEKQLSGYTACYFCLGVSAYKMNENDYSRITHGFTLHMASTLLILTFSQRIYQARQQQFISMLWF